MREKKEESHHWSLGGFDILISATSNQNQTAGNGNQTAGNGNPDCRKWKPNGNQTAGNGHKGNQKTVNPSDDRN
jgi:hypothetical protein